jgi:hypothetical protein
MTHTLLHQAGRDIKATRISDRSVDKSAPEINGAWIGNASGPDGKPLEVTYVLEAKANALIGSVSTAGGGPFADGKIEGNKFSFKTDTNQGTFSTTGILSGDTIEITQTVGDQSSKFTIKRVKPGK